MADVEGIINLDFQSLSKFEQSEVLWIFHFPLYPTQQQSPSIAAPSSGTCLLPTSVGRYPLTPTIRTPVVQRNATATIILLAQLIVRQDSIGILDISPSWLILLIANRIPGAAERNPAGIMDIAFVL
jgi:hypothetical protein